MRLKFLVVVFGVCTLQLGYCQDAVPVVEASTTEQLSPPVLEEVTADAGMASKRYDLMQDLREEVQLLRGRVEELSYELRRVKQQQLDDYLDVDRRLSALLTGSQVANQANESKDSSDNNPLAQDASAEAEDNLQLNPDESGEQTGRAFYETAVREDYNSASGRLLKDRDIEGALVALKGHLEAYPNSPFAANAHYWLGEIYLLRGDTGLAREEFTTILDTHRTHPKAIDSKFKLGKIYFELGEIETARVLLEDAAKTSGGVAAKAQSFLDQNFQ